MTGEPQDIEDDVSAEAVNWLLRLQDVDRRAESEQAFAVWINRSQQHRDAYACAERVWGITAALDPLDKPSPRAIVQPSSTAAFARRKAVGDGLSQAAKRGRHRHRFAVATVAAVAAVLLLLLGPQLALYLKADYRTSIAGQQDVRLEDGTLISLNAASAIAVDYSQEARHVTLLAGEILVKVAADPQRRPFSLMSGDLVITDIGTIFDANARQSSLTVSVEEGAVQVDYARFSASARLGKDERLRVDLATGRMDQDKIDGNRIGAWRSGQLVVDALPIGEVVEELRRYYRGVIVLRDDTLIDRRVSGVFDLNKPLSALGAVVEPFTGHVQQWTPYLVTVTAAAQPGVGKP